MATKCIYKVLKQQTSWQDYLVLDNPALDDLKWWFDTLLHCNGSPTVHKSIEVQVETDASGFGWGA